MHVWRPHSTFLLCWFNTYVRGHRFFSWPNIQQKHFCDNRQKFHSLSLFISYFFSFLFFSCLTHFCLSAGLAFYLNSSTVFSPTLPVHGSIPKYIKVVCLYHNGRELNSYSRVCIFYTCRPVLFYFKYSQLCKKAAATAASHFIDLIFIHLYIFVDGLCHSSFPYIFPPSRPHFIICPC